jgi:hypothetical protein
MDGIRYELTKNVSLFSNISAALYGMSQVQLDLGANYRISLFPSGRWFFLDLGLAASTSSSKMEIAEMSNDGRNLNINGKTFDSKSVNVIAGNSRSGAKGVAGFAVRMGKKYELFVDGSYMLPFLHKRDYVQFKETSGFIFTRKSAKVDWDDPYLNFQVNGNSVNTPRFSVEPYQFRIGIRSGF